MDRAPGFYPGSVGVRVLSGSPFLLAGKFCMNNTRVEIRIIGLVKKLPVTNKEYIEYEFREVGVENIFPSWISAEKINLSGITDVKSSIASDESIEIISRLDKNIKNNEELLLKLKEALTKPILYWKNDKFADDFEVFVDKINME